MRMRWPTAFGIGLWSTCPVVGQVPELPPSVGPSAAVAEAPVELPLLLTPPPLGTPAPQVPGPVDPRRKYDPGYLYLPDTNPSPGKLPPCPCRPLGTLWLVPTVELGWSSGQHLPTAVLSGTNLPSGGVAPGPVVFGNRSFGEQPRIGFGLSGGAWLDRCQTQGIDAGFYYLSQGSTAYTVFSPAANPLLLPVTVGTPATAGFFPLASLRVGNGAYQASDDTRFESADVNYRRNLYCESDARLDALVGYRYGHLGEGIAIYNKRMAFDGNLIRTKDYISAANDFHGGQLGLSGEYRVDRWYADLTGKVALGETFTATDLEGAFRVNGTVVPFGFYSKPAVAGVRNERHFAVMPTVNAAFGRQVSEYGRVFVGYSFQYLSSVLRPADVFDPVPALNGPGTGMKRDATTSDFWVQSVNLGLDWRY